jgi:hypothetical protein
MMFKIICSSGLTYAMSGNVFHSTIAIILNILVARIVSKGIYHIQFVCLSREIPRGIIKDIR